MSRGIHMTLLSKHGLQRGTIRHGSTVKLSSAHQEGPRTVQV